MRFRPGGGVPGRQFEMRRTQLIGDVDGGKIDTVSPINVKKCYRFQGVLIYIYCYPPSIFLFLFVFSILLKVRNYTAS